MKKIIYTLLVALAFVSCYEDVESYGDEGAPVTFGVSSIASTRGEGSTVIDKTGWDDKDLVLIWQVEGAASTTACGVYEITDALWGAGSLSYVSGREFTVLSDVSETFYALYPYSEDMVVAGQGVCLTEEHLANDVIWATATSVGTEVNFSFTHFFAKLQFTFVDNSSLNFTYPLTAQLYNVKSGVTSLGSNEETYTQQTEREFEQTLDGIDVVFDAEENYVATVYAFVDPEEESKPSLYVASDDYNGDNVVARKFDFEKIDGRGVTTYYTATIDE